MTGLNPISPLVLPAFSADPPLEESGFEPSVPAMKTAVVQRRGPHKLPVIGQRQRHQCREGPEVQIPFRSTGESANSRSQHVARVMRIYESCMAISAFADAHPSKQPDAEYGS